MEPFIGQIMLFAGNFAPRGWALCDGQLVAIDQNSALFSILGTTYGGDGRTTFGLPDLRGRAPIHAGTGPGLTTRGLGEKGGVENVTLNVDQLPAHGHGVACNSEAGARTDPAGNVLASSGAEIYKARGDEAMDPRMIRTTGGDAAHENMAPFLAMNYVIALEGIYPSRN